MWDETVTVTTEFMYEFLVGHVRKTRRRMCIFSSYIGLFHVKQYVCTSIELTKLIFSPTPNISDYRLTPFRLTIEGILSIANTMNHLNIHILFIVSKVNYV